MKKFKPLPGYEELELDMKEAYDFENGKIRKLTRFTSYTLLMPPEPKEVLQIRKSNKLSQTGFARLLNVGVRSIQAWEQGTRRPDGAATALLWLLEGNPKIAKALKALTPDAQVLASR